MDDTDVECAARTSVVFVDKFQPMNVPFCNPIISRDSFCIFIAVTAASNYFCSMPFRVPCSLLMVHAFTVLSSLPVRITSVLLIVVNSMAVI